ncbi:MAG: glycosyltransferase family 39 protein [Phycisphaerae bacterium]|nr:glycosyltransferase family 39 protein [Phycisphaerae bacterium]
MTIEPKRIRLSRDFLIAAGIFAFALLIRLIYFFQASDNPASYTPTVDSVTYHEAACGLLKEGVMDGRFFWQSFFYPFFLSRLYYFTGPSVVAAKLFNFLLGSVTAVLIYALGKKLFGRQTAILAAVIFALYGPCISFEAELLATAWACFFAVSLVMLLIKSAEPSAKKWFCLAAGIFAGLSIITRATFVPFVAASAIWLAWKLWRNSLTHKSAVLKTLSFVGPAMVIPLMVGLLCYIKIGCFFMLPPSGSVNLYIGNNPNSEQTVMIRPGEQWNDLMAMPQMNGIDDKKGDARFYMQKFLDYMKNNPGSYLKGLLNKTSQFCCSRELPRNTDVYINRKYSSLMSVLIFKIGNFGFPFGLLLPLAAIGIALNFRRIPIVILLFLILYPLSLILVFICDRYRLPIIPILCIPAAVTILQIYHVLKIRRFVKAAVIILAVLILAIAVSLAGPFVQEKYDYQAEMDYFVAFGYYSKEDYAKAYEYVSKAIARRQDYADAYALLGMIYSDTGRPDLAVESLSKSLEIYPIPYIRRYLLARNLLKLNRTDEAGRQLTQALAASEQKMDFKRSSIIRNLMALIPEPNAPAE